ncbi:MAG: hydantoinase B/oxoprolinase family protein [Chloroflexi bacterium]|nr:hydantoinase B/oxoprolinase family protein [Chloroflexota bacterium]
MDAITLEVARNRLTAIADEMEASLLRAAYSAIVKEGLGASAALFDHRGQVVAQAAAIPIHLSCLVPAVEHILRLFPTREMADGDVYILNDPYQGGTHLPDITLVMPVFARADLVGFATTMCHHQEIGGMVPGSLPPNATDLFQEGLRIPPLKLVERGRPVEPIVAILRSNVRVAAGTDSVAFERWHSSRRAKGLLRRDWEVRADTGVAADRLSPGAIDRRTSNRRARIASRER